MMISDRLLDCDDTVPTLKKAKQTAIYKVFVLDLLDVGTCNAGFRTALENNDNQIGVHGCLSESSPVHLA